MLTERETDTTESSKFTSIQPGTAIALASCTEGGAVTDVVDVLDVVEVVEDVDVLLAE